MTAHDRCDYAACSLRAVHSDGPWDFCAVHWPQHQAEQRGLPLPELSRHQQRLHQAAVTIALRPSHGTLARVRQHYRHGEQPCQECRTAELVAANPTQRTRRSADGRASW